MAGSGVIFVLHAHLPYVHHLDREDRLEDLWLFEALSESYLPLLRQLERWEAQSEEIKLTLSLSPPLLAMLTNPLLKERYRQHLRRMIQSSERELLRTRTHAELLSLSQDYAERYRGLFLWYEEHQGDVVGAFSKWARRGRIQLWTSAASHAFLPFLPSDRALERQIDGGIQSFVQIFGQKPEGFWLPECGYRPGVERWLGRQGMRFTVVNPPRQELPASGIFRPFRLGAGVHALPRATDLSMRVWDAHGGYPGSPWYRDFYRDIGFELDDGQVAPYLYPAGIRRATGFKYWRVTGKEGEKALYQPQAAAAEVSRHAIDFADRIREALAGAEAQGIKDPVVTLPFDAELFGHWWAEGVDWLGQVLPKLPLGYAKEMDQTAMDDAPGPLALSSWGRGGFGEVWCNPKNDFVYPELTRADQALAHADTKVPSSAWNARLMTQAARELVLAESSDWAFMLDQGSTVDYARMRLKTHFERFWQLLGWRNQAETPVLAEQVRAMEAEDALPLGRDASPLTRRPVKAPDSVLLLSWEYPPHVVGGLGQHVYDLSRYLVLRGRAVTVLTVSPQGSKAPPRGRMSGVEVVRVPVAEPSGENFWDWVLAMNLALYQAALGLPRPAVIHAHDWLVADAAIALKQAQSYRPLVVTIHATERGRQGGIYTRLQEQIDEQERRLTEGCDRVIVCSRAMKSEIIGQWKTPSPKILVVPNGVDPARVNAGQGTPRGYQEGHRWLLFFGRLVPEKGIDLLLQAMVEVLKTYPDVRLAVLGSGPYRKDLEGEAERLEITKQVSFLGFARQPQRNLWLAYSQAALFPSRYEPFGIAALEAMAAGVPVIAAQVGGMADFIVDEKNGLLVPPDHPLALADAIIRVLSDPAWAESLVEQALSDVRHYSWDQIARRTEHTYTRLLKVERDRSRFENSFLPSAGPRSSRT